MDIDIIKLEDKIEDLLSKVPSAKSVTEYKYLVISLRTLNALYNETDIEELNNIEAEIQSNLLSILK